MQAGRILTQPSKACLCVRVALSLFPENKNENKLYPGILIAG